MSDIVCHICGRVTNTAVCEWLNPRREDGKANHCYAAFVNGKWEKGCAYEKCDSWTKPTVDNLLKNDLNDKNTIDFPFPEYDDD